MAIIEYVELINRIAIFEPVTVIGSHAQWAGVQSSLNKSNIDWILHEVDDGWIRDCGPLTVVDDAGNRALIDFLFNSWGEKFLPCNGDSSVTRRIAEGLGVARFEVPFVLEGGAISFNGRGAALVVEECVLADNRNGPGVSRLEFDRIAQETLGVENLVWIPFGLVEDLKNTDGHVDNVAVFVSEDLILVQSVPRDDVNYDRLRENRHALERWSGADVIECPYLPRATISGAEGQPAPYINFALTCGSVILPSVGSDFDNLAHALFSEIFPDREVCMTPANAMTLGGGGPHCVSMQIPIGGA